MSGRMDGLTDGLTKGRIDGWTDGRTSGRPDERTEGWMDERKRTDIQNASQENIDQLRLNVAIKQFHRFRAPLNCECALLRLYRSVQEVQVCAGKDALCWSQP